MKKDSPLRAIRQKCLECSYWVAKDVRECIIPNCALYPYRMGHKPRTKKNPDTDNTISKK